MKKFFLVLLCMERFVREDVSCWCLESSVLVGSGSCLLIVNLSIEDEGGFDVVDNALGVFLSKVRKGWDVSEGR